MAPALGRWTVACRDHNATLTGPAHRDRPPRRRCLGHDSRRGPRGQSRSIFGRYRSDDSSTTAGPIAPRRVGGHDILPLGGQLIWFWETFGAAGLGCCRGGGVGGITGRSGVERREQEGFSESAVLGRCQLDDGPPVGGLEYRAAINLRQRFNLKNLPLGPIPLPTSRMPTQTVGAHQVRTRHGRPLRVQRQDDQADAHGRRPVPG